MYKSPLFVKSLRYASCILRPNRIYILSAKYGLLNLDEEIDPYDETLRDKNRKEKREWAKKVVEQLKRECDANADTFFFLAGKDYYGDLVNCLSNTKILMEGLAIGKRLQWLNEELEKEVK
jgi:hypothetical protein